jgi:hypothetical protein
MSRRASKAAYFLVDTNTIPAEHRAEIMDDVAMGGGEFGLRVVEEVHNGPARSQILGVYFGPDEEKWTAAKAEFGIADVETDEVALVEGAQEQTDNAAAAAQAAEEARVAAIVGEEAPNKAPKR